MQQVIHNSKFVNDGKYKSIPIVNFLIGRHVRVLNYLVSLKVLKARAHVFTHSSSLATYRGKIRQD